MMPMIVSGMEIICTRGNQVTAGLVHHQNVDEQQRPAECQTPVADTSSVIFHSPSPFHTTSEPFGVG